MLSNEPPDELHRRSPAWYRGTAWVHWTMTIAGRRQGWLDAAHHSRFREILLHTCSRYHLLCPAYCLMPDHAHILLMGLSGTSDQRNAVKFLRRAWNTELLAIGFELQKQGYDHVLDENERNRLEFEDTLLYILNNPVRANLVETRDHWPFTGAIAAGYPDFHPADPFQKYCERLWKIHHRERARLEGM